MRMERRKKLFSKKRKKIKDERGQIKKEVFGQNLTFRKFENCVFPHGLGKSIE